MKSSYEAVPYDDRPVAETHVDHLHAVATLAGLSAAAPAQARVLELGCAHAVNLLPQATALPSARFVGVDLSPRQIEVAERRVKALGLANVRVSCADVMDLELGDQRFDYVVAHGLFSWVPDAVRDRVLTLAREVLAPNGVLYLSYNAMPAWGIRDGVRRAIVELVGDASDDRERVRRARDGLAALRTSWPLEGTPEGALLAAEIDELRDKPDAYLLHEYLVPFSRAYWLREMIELARGARLTYVDDVAPSGLSPEAIEHTRAAISSALEERSRDRVAVDQLLDVVTFKQFRASLFCRDDATLNVPSPSSWLASMWASAEPTARGERHDGHTAMAHLRAAWPSDLPCAALAETETDHDALATRTISAWRSGEVTLRGRSLGVARASTERPRVWPVTRLEATELSFVTTPRHAYAPLDPFHAALIRQLDGSRTVAEIVDALAREVREGRLRAGGAPAEQVIAALPRLVDSGLALLHRVGILLA